jgi:hypothetical protein
VDRSKSYINDVIIKSSEKSVKDPIKLKVSFSIQGLIREVFIQRNWEKAYDKHDNYLRIGIELAIKNNGKIIETIKTARKAILFWTRNPKINHRIWVSIVKDESPYYPLKEEEARTALFDFEKDIELKRNNMKKGKNKISVTAKVSWANHEYIGKDMITKDSNVEEIEIDE